MAAVLREGAQRIDVDGTPSQVGPSVEELRAAADEIERLRSLFRAVLADPMCSRHAGTIAREALGIEEPDWGRIG